MCEIFFFIHFFLPQIMITAVTDWAEGAMSTAEMVRLTNKKSIIFFQTCLHCEEKMHLILRVHRKAQSDF